MERFVPATVQDLSPIILWFHSVSISIGGQKMRLTTKGRFAVTAMIDLALHSADGPVTLAGISERQKISLSYLEHASIPAQFSSRRDAQSHLSQSVPASCNPRHPE